MKQTPFKCKIAIDRMKSDVEMELVQYLVGLVCFNLKFQIDLKGA